MAKKKNSGHRQKSESTLELVSSAFVRLAFPHRKMLNMQRAMNKMCGENAHIKYSLLFWAKGSHWLHEKRAKTKPSASGPRAEVRRELKRDAVKTDRLQIVII